MDFFRIECFLKAAEVGNMTKAAERMNMTQPAMSFQIRELEKEVQLTLFERDRNGIYLTAAGRIMRDGFVRLLDGYHDLLADARACAYGKSRLAIGYNGPVNWAGIAYFIGEFTQRHPDIDVAILQQQWKELADYLEMGVLDAAFLETSEVAGRRSLVCVPLFADKACFGIAPFHPLASKEAITASDLLEEKILMNNHPSHSMDHMVERLIQAGIRRDSFLFFDQTEITLTMAAAGKGLAVVPRSFMVKDSALLYAEFSSRQFVLEHSLAWKGNTENPALQIFCEEVKKVPWPYPDETRKG